MLLLTLAGPRSFFLGAVVFALVQIPAALLCPHVSDAVGRKGATLGFFVLLALGSFAVLLVDALRVGDWPNTFFSRNVGSESPETAKKTKPARASMVCAAVATSFLQQESTQNAPRCADPASKPRRRVRCLRF